MADDKSWLHILRAYASLASINSTKLLTVFTSVGTKYTMPPSKVLEAIEDKHILRAPWVSGVRSQNSCTEGTIRVIYSSEAFLAYTTVPVIPPDPSLHITISVAFNTSESRYVPPAISTNWPTTKL
jgi:hypothetical protein